MNKTLKRLVTAIAATAALALIPLAALASPASASAGQDHLSTNEVLQAGQYIRSSNGYWAVVQSDGNFVLYTAANRPLWASNTVGTGAHNWLAMQSDGNLVLYNQANRPVWANNRNGYGGANWLAMQTDGNLVEYTSANHPVWATNTVQVSGGTSSLGGGVNMQNACNAQYPGRGLTATATDSKNAYSWKCVGSGVSLGIDVGSQCRAQYGAGAVAAVANPASAWSWYCYNSASSSGEGCVFNAPALAFGLAGHVGWGFELPGGNWEFGANEGPKWWPLVKADVSNTAAHTGSEATMLAWFINAGGYTRYRCVTVPAFNASAAEQQVSREQNELYLVPSQDCESQAYNVLNAYGVKNLPNDGWSDPLPNNWFNGLSSAGFGGPTSL